MKILSTALIVVCSASFLHLHAQKETCKTLTVEFSIAPLTQQPEKPVTYTTVLNTAIDPLTYDEEFQAVQGTEAQKAHNEAIQATRSNKLNALRETYLALSGPRFIRHNNNTPPDWTVTLTTSDLNITYSTTKNLDELEDNDTVFRYTYSAVVTTTAPTGNVIWQKSLSIPDKVHAMTKAMVVNNPSFKLQKASATFLDKKSHLVLYEVLEMADKALTSNYEIQPRKFTVGIFSVKGKGFDELNTVNDNLIETNARFKALGKKNRIQKEEVDHLMLEAIAVWNKYLSRRDQLDDNVVKGLLLNCALAYTWLNNIEKASSYLDQVDNARPGTPIAAAPAQPSPATTDLPTYATNMRNLLDEMKTYEERVVMMQYTY